MKKIALLTIAAALFGSAVLPSVAVAQQEGNLRYSITVAKFKNEASWHGQWSVGDGFATMMTDALQESGNFIVLGDSGMREDSMKEQDLVASGRTAQGNKSANIGRLTPAQLLVRGSITHVQKSTTGGAGGIRIAGVKLGGGKDSAEVNITIYLVNSETGQVAASTRVVGKSERKSFSLGYFGSKLGGLTGGLSGFEKDNVGKACQDAVGQAVAFLTEQLEDVPWEGTIILAKGSKIVMNRGNREGVREGMVFVVGDTEELVDTDTGEVLDVEVTEIAKVEVSRIKDKIAYLKTVSGDISEIQKGMSVTPAS
jgi:curli biogenesis system outer membrane secretion channel CsgG|tara:strand:+ start:304 stop:1239 length:936 start_codon:yes stop_codon:yes gene_type:complete